MRNLTIVCFTIYNIQVYQIKEDEMGETCSLYAEDEKCLQNFSQKLLTEETKL
jgi:hypothetical protein